VLKKPDDDLFKDSTMTFGEHLEELRSALFKAVLWLFAGCAIGLFFADWLVQYINKPLESALKAYYQNQAIQVVENDVGPISDEQRAAILEHGRIFEPVYVEPQAIMASLQAVFSDDVKSLSLPRFWLTDELMDGREWAALGKALASENPAAAHIWKLLPQKSRDRIKGDTENGELDSDEVRSLVRDLNHLLDSKALCSEVAFADVTLSNATSELLKKSGEMSRDQRRELNWRLVHDSFPRLIGEPQPTLVPIMMWRLVKNDDRLKPKSLGVQEPFMLWLKAGFLAGFVIASPFVFYHLWMFVAAGLYPHEKRYVHIFLPVSILLFIGGAVLCLTYVFEPVLSYLFKFNASLGIDPDPRIGEWLGFFLMLPLGFGVAFQLPLVMLFLERIGIFTVHSYLAKWKIAVLSITILACVLTPADPISFMFLGVPLLLLYFGGIGLCWLWPRKGRLQMA
jgi:sec-independent protein translocase protein TatC